MSLSPLVALIALLFLADALIVRLDLLPVWSTYSTPVILAAVVVLVLSVFQLDSPASLNGRLVVPAGAEARAARREAPAGTGCCLSTPRHWHLRRGS